MEKKDDDPDLISDLHDSILTHILSFIPTVESARTSVLSSRWRNLWTLVPALNFPHGKNKPKQIESAIRSLLSPKIINAKLMSSLPIERFLRACSSFSLEKLKLFSSSLCYLPMSTLSASATSLRVLSLENCELADPGPIKFRHLADLSLRNVYVEDSTFERFLSSSCCHIEKLTINYCGETTRVKFCLPKLKILKLKCSSIVYIDVEVPNLMFVEFKGHAEYLDRIFLRKVEKLQYAALHSYQNYFDPREKKPKYFGGGVGNLIREFAQAKHLEIITFDHEVTWEWIGMREFPIKSIDTTVKKLTLFSGCSLSNFLLRILDILMVFSNLETLVMQLDRKWALETDCSKEKEEETVIYFNNYEWSAINCLTKSLKRIEIKYFHGFNREIELVKLLLKKSTRLESLCFINWSKKMQINEILRLKTSIKVEIVYIRRKKIVISRIARNWYLFEKERII